MRNDVVLPDFSASHTDKAAVPGATPVATPAVAGAAEAVEAAPGQAVRETGQPDGAAGVHAGLLNTPPFSWLGDDAWPEFTG